MSPSAPDRSVPPRADEPAAPGTTKIAAPRPAELAGIRVEPGDRLVYPPGGAGTAPGRP
ncbi:hypothetical protein [Actinomadura roseirufa]|uniref:hypothetical protein n=1 Tax=Actinomadura roseirufa TaxID=2094049 RepID=UPI0013F1450E|nr:hypothetical protein [Actinomadura roseirufa]